MFMSSYFHHLDTAGVFQGCLYTLHFIDQEKWTVFQVFHAICGCNTLLFIGGAKICSRKTMLTAYYLICCQSICNKDLAGTKQCAVYSSQYNSVTMLNIT